jgi:dCTP deaminase
LADVFPSLLLRQKTFQQKQKMILTDGDILREMEKGNIVIRPFNRSCLGSNSYDVHLGSKLAVYMCETLDAKAQNPIRIFEIPKEGFILQPNELYLGVTEEYTETHNHVPFLEGKSSTGRLGISIHATAGKGDISFQGTWTLEISCLKPVKIYPHMPIGQLIYFEVNADSVLVPYNKKNNAKYNGQGAEPVESMMFMNKF